MSDGLYIMDENGKIVPEPDCVKWAMWYEKVPLRRVAVSHIGNTTISTVFLAIDMAYNAGPPILWETLVFGGPLAKRCYRCAGSREQAEAMHEKMVEKVRAAQ